MTQPPDFRPGDGRVHREEDGRCARAVIQKNRLSGCSARGRVAETLDLSPDGLADDQLAIETGFELRRRGVEVKIITGQFERAPDQTLINAIARAHQWLAEARRGVSLAAIGRRYGWTDSPIRQRIRLAFLAPAITRAILEGRQPPELTLQYLLTNPVPLDWDAQAQALGFFDRKLP